MSATGRSDVRKAADFYETPAWVTRSILKELPKTGPVLDAGCGKGAILRVLKEKYKKPGELYGMDVVTPFVHACAKEFDNVFVGNFLEARQPSSAPWKVIVANPPYQAAEQFVRKGLELVGKKGTVAMLLRLNWLAGQKRAQFHREHPADVYVFSKRPSFTGGGTDATEYAFFIWGPGRGNRWFLAETK